MGKTARWFRALLGGKKEKDSSSSKKKGWGFVKSFRDKEPSPVGSYRQEPSSSTTTYFEGNDPNKHAIAVAAATAAVAEAAVAAAQAAAAVVKLTSSGRCTTPAYVNSNEIRKDFWAVVKIQSTFRGYLARRALKALKGLVKLQALVRGHIIRKKTAEQMRCMQALVRVQSRARASRTHTPKARHPNIKPPTSHHPGPATPEKYEHAIRSNSARHDRVSTLKRNSSRSNSRDVFDWDKNQSDHYKGTPMKYGSTDDEKTDKILEIDPGKPQLNTKHRNLSYSSQQQVVLDQLSLLDSPSKDSTTAHQSCSSPSSGEVQSRNPRRLPHNVDDEAFCTAENSPQFYSATSVYGSSRRGPFTPTGSDCSRSFVSVYSDHPNYMSNTESFQAKVRSQSAPRQRLEFEKSSSARRYNVNGFQGFADARPTTQRASSTLRASFTSKAYPGSGRLDRLGMPIQNESLSFTGVYQNRHNAIYSTR